jgi:cysteine desulfurase
VFARYDLAVCVYLDVAATAPVDPRVREALIAALDPSVGNAGSRTHDFGRRARRIVEEARYLVSTVVHAQRADVTFTSGATEANNLAILGLSEQGFRTGRRHVVSTAIEHHAVEEPLRVLLGRGFEVTFVRPRSDGVVRADDILAAVRADTLLVSVMHVNNETGVIQPIDAIADGLSADEGVFFHVDAAQGYGKVLEPLRHPRIDLISVSGHKFGAPQGIGALINRRRGGRRAPLTPVMHGGGQERGLRPGTVPVALIAALGRAAELAVAEHAQRVARCDAMGATIIAGLAPLQPVINGTGPRVPHILNLSFPGVDGETVVEAWSGLVAVSNGAACTSAQYTCSHVLRAMQIPTTQAAGAVRLSWQHDTPVPPIADMVAAVESARAGAVLQ